VQCNKDGDEQEDQNAFSEGTDKESDDSEKRRKSRNGVNMLKPVNLDPPKPRTKIMPIRKVKEKPKIL
jgi:hypothetical protein